MGQKVKEIVWSQFATATLQIIYDYIAQDSIKQAEKQVKSWVNGKEYKR